MEAGYDYLLLRGRRHLFSLTALFLAVFGVLLLAGGGAYYAYAAKARADLDQLNVSVPGPATTFPDSQDAQMPPAPSIHAAPIVEDAPTTRSKSTEAFVGAAGTKARFAGWSVEIVAGARMSPQILKASCPPMPSGVIVRPASFVSSVPLIVRSSGWGLAIRSRA